MFLQGEIYLPEPNAGLKAAAKNFLLNLTSMCDQSVIHSHLYLQRGLNTTCSLSGLMLLKDSLPDRAGQQPALSAKQEELPPSRLSD
jgi:hypothetical protein